MNSSSLESSSPLDAAFGTWLLTAGVVVVLGLLVCFAWTAISVGPLVAGDRIFAALKGILQDLIRLSPRRTLAIAWLAVKESVRKQAVAGVIIFVLILAFALWFLDADGADPSALYVGFVMNAVNYLVLLLALLTSTFSLPNDIKNKTIFTIVTKPVRPTEIVLGRMLGFTAVCTVPLAAMGLCSYLFVVRSLDHTHTLVEADLRPIAGSAAQRLPAGTKQGTTSLAQGHRHRVTLDPQGTGVTEVNEADRLELDDAVGFQDRFGRSHWHTVTAETRDGRTVYHVGPPQGRFHARVPIKGTLRFKDAAGVQSASGYNVGNWTKRGYVAGGTLSAAVFTFDGVTEQTFPDGLQMELNIRLFRTTKDDLDKPLLGSIVLRNPINGLSTAPRSFAAREYFTLQQLIPRTLVDSSGNAIDLFRDLTVNGQVEVELQCIPHSQFFGVGPDDVYLLAREGRFDVNFAKGFVGIWLQMVLTIVIGVFWSTFLGGPVATLATAACVVGALLRPFLVNVIRDELYEGTAHTGGVLESIVRATDQRAMKVELDEGTATTVIRAIDGAISFCMDLLFRLIPDFSAMSDVDSVAGGFDVSPHLLGLHTMQMLGFALPLALLACIIFKQTEIAK
jgi:hypothetical protein